MGKKIVAKNREKVAELGLEIYQNNNFSEVIKLIKNDSSNYFDSSEEILETSDKLLSQAEQESKNWFAVLPSGDVSIKPYEPHESGSGSYEGAAGDKPAYFRISLSNPKKQARGYNEKLVYHETYPGHHLQMGIEKDIKGLHPISEYVFFGSYVEGWARYSEQLAEEMGLYQNRSALIGRRAWPARGMVVDPGIHLKGWSKQKAIEYMKETGMSDEGALSLYHRLIVWPAQLTSYDVGGEEIKELRRIAENNLGPNFNIKKFHSKILENGSVPLGYLRAFIEEWIQEETEEALRE